MLRNAHMYCAAVLLLLAAGTDAIPCSVGAMYEFVARRSAAAPVKPMTSKGFVVGVVIHGR